MSQWVEYFWDEDPSHYRNLVRQIMLRTRMCRGDDAGGLGIRTSPDFLNQDKMICSEDHWVAAGNAVAMQMQCDIERMEETHNLALSIYDCDGKTMWQVWSDDIDKIRNLRRELTFWEQKELCTKSFRVAKAESKRERTNHDLFYTLGHLVDWMEGEVQTTGDYIATCLFILHMQEAEKLIIRQGLLVHNLKREAIWQTICKQNPGPWPYCAL